MSLYLPPPTTSSLPMETNPNLQEVEKLTVSFITKDDFMRRYSRPIDLNDPFLVKVIDAPRVADPYGSLGEFQAPHALMTRVAVLVRDYKHYHSVDRQKFTSIICNLHGWFEQVDTLHLWEHMIHQMGFSKTHQYIDCEDSNELSTIPINAQSEIAAAGLSICVYGEAGVLGNEEGPPTEVDENGEVHAVPVQVDEAQGQVQVQFESDDTLNQNLVHTNGSNNNNINDTEIRITNEIGTGEGTPLNNISNTAHSFSSPQKSKKAESSSPKTPDCLPLVGSSWTDGKSAIKCHARNPQEHKEHLRNCVTELKPLVLATQLTERKTVTESQRTERLKITANKQIENKKLGLEQQKFNLEKEEREKKLQHDERRLQLEEEERRMAIEERRLVMEERKVELERQRQMALQLQRNNVPSTPSNLAIASSPKKRKHHLIPVTSSNGKEKQKRGIPSRPRPGKNNWKFSGRVVTNEGTGQIIIEGNVDDFLSPSAVGDIFCLTCDQGGRFFKRNQVYSGKNYESQLYLCGCDGPQVKLVLSTEDKKTNVRKYEVWLAGVDSLRYHKKTDGSRGNELVLKGLSST